MIILCLKEGYTKTHSVVQVRVLAAGRAALPLPRHLLLLRAAAAAQPHLRRQTQQVANHSAAAGHVTPCSPPIGPQQPRVAAGGGRAGRLAGL